MVVWLEGLLNSVALWIKYIIMMVCSFFATLLPMPVPIADISFIANLQAFNSLYWYSIIIMTITITFETEPTGDLLTWLEANAVKQ